MLVKPFDPTLDTFLVTDASRLYGLGYALLQKHTDNSQRLIKCGSCSLTSTQNNYATIELECLAIVWAVTKCKYYLHGLQHFTVVTYHKPLVGIFNSSLDNLSNPRLLRMREKLTDYVFTTTWVAGKTHDIADALRNQHHPNPTSATSCGPTSPFPHTETASSSLRVPVSSSPPKPYNQCYNSYTSPTRDKQRL